MTADFFPGFTRQRFITSGAEINALIGGAGPPLLLLHGYPQTHLIWHKIAARLAERFTVVAADLRGYGDSSMPPAGERQTAYAKRAMAQDQMEVMQALGYEKFSVVGHDRGARVAHRMALDHGARIGKLALLDIVPTLYVYEYMSQAVGTGYFHWFFLIQPHDFPEHYIGKDPAKWLNGVFGRWGADEGAFPAAVRDEYLRCFARPEAIRASCDDYRAAAGIDLDHDRADRGRMIGCPVLVLWGENGLVGKNYDVLAVWRERGRDVQGRALACGHFLPEEQPDETLRALVDFLDARAPALAGG
ncbi:MAG: alpha/beta fold hydrolase [Pseudonocardiaceae bacterium]